MGLAAAEKHLAARFNKDDMKIVDHYTYVSQHASVVLQPESTYSESHEPLSTSVFQESCIVCIPVCSDAQVSSVMLMSSLAIFFSTLLVSISDAPSCVTYRPVCKGGGAASAGMSSWETAATWRESPMRQLPWLVTGSSASSLPSTMTTSEPSPHDEVAFRPLRHICDAASQFTEGAANY